MTTLDTFSFTRFKAVLRQYFSSNKKQLIGGTIVTLGLLTLIAFVIGHIAQENMRTYYDKNSYMAIPADELFIFKMGFCFFYTISASLTFCSFKNKKRRISSLMLPAAKSEVFLSRVLIYTFLSVLMFMSCCIVADILRSIFIYGPSIWTANNATHFLSDEISTDWDAQLLCLSSLLLNQAVFTLGSAFWPRNSFIITFCVLFIVSMCAILVSPMLNVVLNIATNALEILGIDESFFTLRAITTILFITSILIYWFAWLRFKRMQVNIDFVIR